MNTNTSTERKAYEQKIKAQLKEWNAELDKLQAKAENAAADKKLEAKKKLESLKAKRDSAKEKFEELKSSSDDAWADVKKGFEGAWNTLSGSLESARKQFH